MPGDIKMKTDIGAPVLGVTRYSLEFSSYKVSVYKQLFRSLGSDARLTAQVPVVS